MFDDPIGQNTLLVQQRWCEVGYQSSAAAASQANDFPALLSEREPPHIPRSFALREYLGR